MSKLKLCLVLSVAKFTKFSIIGSLIIKYVITSNIQLDKCTDTNALQNLLNSYNPCAMDIRLPSAPLKQMSQ